MKKHMLYAILDISLWVLLPVYIKTENLDLPPNPANYSLESQSGITILVESVCLGQAKRLAHDFSLALEHGAAPAAQALMIETVRDAEEKGFPIACMLSFGV